MPIPQAASLPELFRAICDTRPAAVAVVDQDTSLTYAELDAAAEAVASRLVTRGVRRGELVGLQTDRSAAVVIGILGILKAGAAYVPLDPAYPEARLTTMAADAGLRFAVADPEHAVKCGLSEHQAVPTTADGAAESVDRVVERDDAAYVIYTSGSTGRPKGCVVTHGNVLALLETALPLFEVDRRDRWALFHSTSFDFSVWELWGALATGGTVVVVPQQAALSPEDFLDLLIRERVTVLNQVPSVFRYLDLAFDEADRPALDVRYVIFGGESVDLEVLRKFVAKFPEERRPTVVNMYGITETTVHVTFKLLDEQALTGPARSPIGVPLPHLTVELRDEEGRPVPPGEPGEMWISGAGVAAGYLNRAELTAERFVTLEGRRFYRSGDLARRSVNGELEYVGRADQQVKLRGFRVELGEIESVLRGCPEVRDAAVTVVTTGAGAQLLAACVVPHDGSVTAAVRRHAAAMLPRHMVPDRYVTVEALPLTPSGKLDRRALDGLVASGRR
ncbi:hypothetical protein GCM10023196_053490 [Actinoallomurus vinaceus]|uniref:Amino acid adenylation domain-containing protein n=1 Tax=Actinoallomurus vinaceus TaxID=1080074 RepID=A0ABP8UFC1_9ACTN